MKIKSKFYKIYFSVLAAFAVLLVALLIFLGGWLGNYEKAQPETIVNGIIENYINKNNVYGIQDIAPLDISGYETADTVNSVISNAINGKTLVASSSASRIENCDVAYTVKADDQKILNVYFKKTESSSDMLAKYEVIKVALDDAFYKSATITLPENAAVKVNGIELKAQDLKTAELLNIPEKYKPQNVSGSRYAVLSNLLSDDISVTATADGTELNVTKNGTQYSVAENISEELSSKISNFAAEASKTYSAYMQEDSSLTAIRKYFATDTDFYENLRTSLVIFALDHEGFRFDDVKTHSVHKFSDNLYSCHVTLTQVLIRNGKEYKDYYNKNVFIYVNGDKMSVIDLQSTGDKK